MVWVIYLSSRLIDDFLLIWPPNIRLLATPLKQTRFTYCNLLTVITTIGYGHIAPKTPVAKIVTIFYAILGIPLTVLCWSNIGDAMANSFRFCYWRVCCYVCTKKPKKKNRRQRTVSR